MYFVGTYHLGTYAEECGVAGSQCTASTPRDNPSTSLAFRSPCSMITSQNTREERAALHWNRRR